MPNHVIFAVITIVVCLLLLFILLTLNSRRTKISPPKPDTAEVIVLKKLLYNLDRLHTGLCILSVDLFANNTLSWEECELLLKIIDANVPSWKFSSTGYYFPRGNKELRRIYLKTLIKKYA